MKKIFYFVIILILINTTIVYAAPAMWGLSLNHKTKECAGYWGGDEFTYYNLPNGWKSYYPDYEKGNFIETEIGTCTFTSDNNMEECCKQLGYTYISSNIGKDTITSWGLQQILLSPLGLVILILLLIILFFIIKYFLKKRKQ